MEAAHIRPDNRRMALKNMELHALIAIAETGNHALPPQPGIDGRSLITGVDGQLGQPQLRAVLMGPCPVQQLCQFWPCALMVRAAVDDDVIDQPTFQAPAPSPSAPPPGLAMSPKHRAPAEPSGKPALRRVPDQSARPSFSGSPTGVTAPGRLSGQSRPLDKKNCRQGQKIYCRGQPCCGAADPDRSSRTGAHRTRQH